MGKKFKHETDIYGYCVLRNEDFECNPLNPHWNSWKTMDSRFMARNALDIYAGAGCEVNYANDRVKFPKNLVIDSIEACPEEFTLCGRDPKNDVVVGGKKVAYKNFGTGVFIIDPYTGEVRESTKKDLCDVARFCDAMEGCDVFSIAVTAGRRQSESQSSSRSGSGSE